MLTVSAAVVCSSGSRHDSDESAFRVSGEASACNAAVCPVAGQSDGAVLLQETFAAALLLRLCSRR